jgi:hypothetical protein
MDKYQFNYGNKKYRQGNLKWTVGSVKEKGDVINEASVSK